MSLNIKAIIGILLVGALIVSSCSESTVNSPTPESESPAIEEQESSINSQDSDNLDLSSVPDMESINKMLTDRGANIRLAYAETVTPGAEAAGQTIFANDRQKRLASQWVLGDERRLADGNNLTHVVDETYSTANFGSSNEIDSEPAIDASFETWNNIKKNAKLEVVKKSDPGIELSAILGGNPYVADITNIGFLPGNLFDLVLGPGSRNNVLGVTFTFNFVDGDGNPTDVNNDGYADVAIKEVWYNDDFAWTTDANSSNIDIETVAVHENGHALGFGHFGKVSITDQNSKLHVSPRAVMNAVILGTQRELLGTDEASYNSIYGNWPKN